MTTHDDRLEVQPAEGAQRDLEVQQDDTWHASDEQQTDQGDVGDAGDVGDVGDDRDLLFGRDAAASFERRWSELQAMFVDDPRGAVQAADGLVIEVTEALTAEFGSHRSDLESQWSEGSVADTERLRVALRRYRAFFQRLLSA